VNEKTSRKRQRPDRAGVEPVWPLLPGAEAAKMGLEEFIMSEFDSVLSAASQLPVAERLRLIDELAATVPDDLPPSLSASWLAEIERRWAELESGTVAAVPWETVRENLFRKIETDRAD
jgi:putative addiction module component (TIGR02574 family)